MRKFELFGKLTAYLGIVVLAVIIGYFAYPITEVCFDILDIFIGAVLEKLSTVDLATTYDGIRDNSSDREVVICISIMASCVIAIVSVVFYEIVLNDD